jgi:hypothetical protein
MKIKQITSVPLPDCYKIPYLIFGLGNDNKIYFWSDKKDEWILESENPNQDK